ncbi:class I SAM-dependent methyltransferase [Papillibacter cinnamivorans]|uniref:Methyltransferase domain-containing protein n=1 Tax=Papillibacter cinnamivorans DSM 12816 TaxID=1122930 RepID=A0A1W2CNJ9_9FIRM|nr:class I SAM-dependent methyltransferase [Papillibacter cinnamivorans]SMC86789.1 Methyltransferase domain-containing protein [Papillibacter cinnamivorans DSM 12816]
MKLKIAGLFSLIAPVYGFFFGYQKRHYKEILEGASCQLDFSQYKTCVDVGCGTGALCSVLRRKGLDVTGVDPARGMLQIASRNNKGMEFVQASVVKGLPFGDKSFDISFASYVAHGLNKEERRAMYAEMGRITKYFVLMIDYNENRSPFVSVVEWLEGGDYFNFIKNPRSEMQEAFADVRAVDVGPRAACYMCVPSDG